MEQKERPLLRNVEFAVRRALRDLNRHLQVLNHQAHQRRHTRWFETLRRYPVLTLEGAQLFASDPSWVAKHLPAQVEPDEDEG